MKQLKPWLVLASLAVVLAACGGGGDSGTQDPGPVPTVSTLTSSAFISYLTTLIGYSAADRSEPAAVPAAFVAPTDDTTETSGV